MLTSVLHMGLVVLEHVDHCNQDSAIVRKLNATKLVKKRIAIVNFSAIVSALYLYDRHNRYCEPGVYSMFSLLEYVTITANVIYHLQAYHDLADYTIYVGQCNGAIATDPMVDSSHNLGPINDKKSKRD